MKYLTYSEALQLCRDKTDQLTQKKQLKKWCESKGLDYHHVQVYIRGDHFKKYPKKRYPKLLKEFLLASGYNGVTVEKKVLYNFTIDNL